MQSPERTVFVDHAAGAPLERSVFASMEPFLTDVYGNPGSFHTVGKRALDAIEDARERIAGHLHVRPDEIVFTSGGTESDNLAILGAVRASKQEAPHVVTTSIEHPAVLETVRHLERKQGVRVSVVDVEENGIVDPKKVLAEVGEQTVLVSVMLANNEIGTVQPVAEIGRGLATLKKDGKTQALFHTDACQAVGYMDVRPEALHIDLLTLNAAKMYGPKGVGALYVKRGVKLMPLQFGGSQEQARRPGTENVAGIIGLASALDLAVSVREKEVERLTVLRDNLIAGILESIPKTRLNGDAADRLPNNVNISFMDIEGEALLLYLDAVGIYASTGSACTSASLDPSHVILALGMPYEVAHGSIRFSLGRTTTQEDVDYILAQLPPLVERLRAISPVNVDEKHWKR